MNIPIKITISEKEKSEGFRTDLPLAVQPPPTYEVIALVLDTEREQTRAYTFHSLVDKTKPTSHEIGEIVITPFSHHEDYLRKVRDEIDELLGDIERDGDRTKIYGEVVDENRDERGHYAVIRPCDLP
jgi:hypothetical protein